MLSHAGIEKARAIRWRFALVEWPLLLLHPRVVISAARHRARPRTHHCELPARVPIQLSWQV